jgi:hypothetical protein
MKSGENVTPVLADFVASAGLQQCGPPATHIVRPDYLDGRTAS